MFAPRRPRMVHTVAKNLFRDEEFLVAEDAGGTGEFEDPGRVGARQVPETRPDPGGHATAGTPTARAAAACWEELREMASSTMRAMSSS